MQWFAPICPIEDSRTRVGRSRARRRSLSASGPGLPEAVRRYWDDRGCPRDRYRHRAPTLPRRGVKIGARSASIQTATPRIRCAAASQRRPRANKSEVAIMRQGRWKSIPRRAPLHPRGLALARPRRRRYRTVDGRRPFNCCDAQRAAAGGSSHGSSNVDGTSTRSASAASEKRAGVCVTTSPSTSIYCGGVAVTVHRELLLPAASWSFSMRPASSATHIRATCHRLLPRSVTMARLRLSTCAFAVIGVAPNTRPFATMIW